MNTYLPILPPDFDERAVKAYQKSIGQCVSTPIASLSKFQEEAKRIFPNNHVLAVASGTAALHLALQVLGVKKGDVVLCPTFTFAATVNCILYQQAEPVFIDSEAVTWNMCPELLEQAIVDLKTEKKSPKAIIVVHAYGTPALLDKICEVAEKYNIPIIEDAAPALGAKFNGQAVGTFGQVGIFSFNYNKIITTGGGGLLVSRKKEYLEQADYLANQARDIAPYYHHREVGYNYRMSGLCAELGYYQLQYLGEKLERKQKIFSMYKSALNFLREESFQTLPANIESNHWLLSVIFSSSKVKERVRERLSKENIETRALWKPMHLQPAFNTFRSFLLGTAEDLFHRGLSLPTGIDLSESGITEISKLIKEVV